MKCIKFWLKLLELPNSELMKACYLLLFQHCVKGRKNWASKVRDLLYINGFGYIWEQQIVYNKDSFLKDFHTRLIDCCKQDWFSKIQDMPRLFYYRGFKMSLCVEKYLIIDMPRRLRVALTKFRTSNHCLEIERGRQYNIKREDRLCKICGQKNLCFIETEYHVLFECSAYEDIRLLYINKYFVEGKSFFLYNNILASEKDDVIVNLATFIYYMFQIREMRLKCIDVT